MAEDDALAQLETLLAPCHPLPELSDWSIGVDTALIIASYIEKTRPSVVVELGSGFSTLVIAYSLLKNKHGLCISVEDDEMYYHRMRAQLQEHGVEDWVQLLNCPLAQNILRSPPQPWYKLPSNLLPGKIDLLIIDGPAGNVHAQARYPALPELWRYLSSHALIMLNDAWRDDERLTVQRWLAEYPGLSCECLPTQKGLYLLKRNVVL